MLQVATFTLPDQQVAANEFLKAHAPEGQVHFNTNMIVVFYDDGTRNSAVEHLAHLRELEKALFETKTQLSVSVEILKLERADLHPKKNAGQFEAITAEIADVQRKLDRIDFKATFVQSRIDELTK